MPSTGSDRATLSARIGASMFFAGALFSLLSTWMPHGPHGDIAGLRWLALGELVTGIVILLIPRRWRGYIPTVVVFGAVAVVSVSVLCNGERGGDAPTMTEFFYAWPAVYVGYFFQRRMVPIFIAVTAAAYGGTLASMELTGNVEIRWMLVVTVVAGLTVAAHAIRTQVNGLIRRLEDAAHTDTLTALPNRRAFDERLAIELSRTNRTDQPLALLIGDVDGFKSLNDRFGHAAGDQALTALGRALMDTCRVIDMPARIGGEEFAVLLPATGGSDAVVTADRLRAAVSAIRDGDGRSLTMSFGVAVHPPYGETADSLLRAADRALYTAKAEGRDRTVLYTNGDLAPA